MKLMQERKAGGSFKLNQLFLTHHRVLFILELLCGTVVVVVVVVVVLSSSVWLRMLPTSMSLTVEPLHDRNRTKDE